MEADVLYKDHTLFLKGPITSNTFGKLRQIVNNLTFTKHLQINFSEITTFDTTGGFLIREIMQSCAAKKIKVTFSEEPKEVKYIMKVVDGVKSMRPPPQSSYFRAVPLTFLRLGDATMSFLVSVAQLFSFFGSSLVSFVAMFRKSLRILVPQTLFFMSRAGVSSIPIILVTSFVVGIVISYEGVIQLAKFGAELSAITLISFSVLREGGVLITAIVVAGRSGSAFAAEIGAMRVNEEIDALQLMGIHPMQFLVVPRILALVIFMPILTVVADIFGLIGGALICTAEIEIGWTYFFMQLRDVTSMETFLIGLGKAPFFGLIIAVVGCLEGMKAKGNAASVGRSTTRAVVKAIFLIILVNSILSVLFSYLRIA